MVHQVSNLSSNRLVLDGSIASTTNASVPVTIQPSLTTSLPYTWTLPNANPNISGSLLTSDTNGQLTWIQPIPQNKIVDTASSVTCNGNIVVIQGDQTLIQSSSGTSLISFLQSGAINCHSNRVMNLPSPQYASDAVNRLYCDANAENRLRVQINESPQISILNPSSTISNAFISRERVETYDTHVTYLYQLQITLSDDSQANTFSFVLPATQSGTGVANRALVLDRYQFIDSDGFPRELAGSACVSDNTVRCRFLGAGINLSHVVTLCIDVQNEFVTSLPVALNQPYTFVAPNDTSQVNLSVVPAGQPYTEVISYEDRQPQTAPANTIPRPSTST